MRDTRSAIRSAIVLAAALFVGPVPRAGAECRVLAPDLGGASTRATPTSPLGQSFVACGDGILTNLAVKPGLSTQSLVVVGLQEGTDLLAPQFEVTKTLPPLGGRLQVPLSFPVVGGRTYSVSFRPVSGILDFGRTHPSYFDGGTMLQVQEGVTVPLEGFMYFSILVSDPPVPAVASTWGTIKSTYR